MHLSKKRNGLQLMAVSGKRPDSCLLHVFDKLSRNSLVLDSGAEVSVLPVPNTLKINGYSGTSLSAANGTKIKTYGSKKCHVDIGLGSKYPCNFIYADITTPILGADFLRSSGLLLDIANRRLIDPRTF